MHLAHYLFARLKQLGIHSLHGVPGDYNLTLLDYVRPAGLSWVGNANELNAAYAADAYARVKGMAALITTFGVGELSAINAIAGAYTERAAVVHIVGTPSRDTQARQLRVHHTFNDGDYRRFGLMHAHVTVAQTRLVDRLTCTRQIDDVLLQCLLHSRPVYIEVPADMVSLDVLPSDLERPLQRPIDSHSPVHQAALDRLKQSLQEAKQPIIFVDGETRPLGVVDDVQRLIQETRWPTWTTGFGKGLVDETLSNVHGIFRGSFDSVAVQHFFAASDLILCIGPHFSTTNSYQLASVPKPASTISISDAELNIYGQVFRDIPAKTVLSWVLDVAQRAPTKYNEGYPSHLPRDQIIELDRLPHDEIIRQDKLWRAMAGHLQPGDTVMGETGTPGYGVRDMPLPQHARFFCPVTWLSIGYMLPAAQGAALAQRELMQTSNHHDLPNARTWLFIGDGSFQMTAQELGTIIRHKLDVTLVLINNDGYTIERCIHGVHAHYNDVARWRYLQAPGFLGASENTFVASARTWGELRSILGDSHFQSQRGLRMVEIVLDREDTPSGPLSAMMAAEKTRDASAPVT